MLQRFSLVLAVLAATGLNTANAQEVELGWKFEANKEFFQKMKTATNQTMTINNQEVKQEQEQEFVFKWKVLKVDEKAVELEQTIVSVFMKIKIGSNEITYNSRAADATENPLTPFFKPLVNAQFKISLDPKTFKINAPVGGRQEFLNKLKEANPAMSQLLNTILSEDQFKQLTEPAFAVLPDKGTKATAGKTTWDRNTKLSMGPIGTYDAEYKYAYAGQDKQGADTYEKITVKTNLKWTAPDAQASGGLPFKIESGTLTTKAAEGTILFDNKNGRLFRSNMKVELEGKLNVAVQEQKAEVNLKQTQNTETTTSEKDPNKPG